MSEPNLNDILSGGGLSSLLQNPEIASKLPRIMEALGPVMAEMRAEQAAEPTAAHGEEGDAKTADKTASASASALLGGKTQRPGSARRCALLKALEPYLSDSRREAMEYIIKVSSLIDILSEVM